MSLEELEFCEHYEANLQKHQILTIAHDNLTPKGIVLYDKLTAWLTDHLNIYLQLAKN